MTCHLLDVNVLIALVDDQFADASRLSHHAGVTDSYLLALARANKGLLATLNRKLAVDAVVDGRAALVLI